ncbi:MAG: transcriptional repressor [Clostridia bacterium]|nr:transcriptional repressor [Clostridia bacterium]
MENSYTTKQGEAVLSLLKSRSGTHFTADEIVAALMKSGVSVGKATVYRHLDKLIKRGLVRKYVVDEGVSACYEFITHSGDCTRHYHLKCSECGRLLHIECKYLDEVSSHILKNHGFIISPEKTVLYGVCESCREGKNA